MGHIASLGVDAGLRLSPFFKSPYGRHGLRRPATIGAVDPMFGTIEAHQTLVAEAHRQGLKVVIDQVLLAHVGQASSGLPRAGPTGRTPRQTAYLQTGRKGAGSERRRTTGSRCSADRPGDGIRYAGNYYLHNFLAAQPDLNFHNPEVRRDALLAAVRFNWASLASTGSGFDYGELSASHDQQAARHIRRLGEAVKAGDDRRRANSSVSSLGRICSTRRSARISTS